MLRYKSKMHKIADGWGYAPDHARGVYNRSRYPWCIYVVGNGKYGFEISEFTGPVGGLPGCVSDLTGNNLANFVWNNIKILLFLNNRIIEVQKNSDFYSTKCFLLSLKCTKNVGGWGFAPDPAGRAYSTWPSRCDRLVVWNLWVFWVAWVACPRPYWK